MQLTECPYCQTQIKDGVFSSNKLLSKSETAIINYVNNRQVAAYCQKCSPGNAAHAESILSKRVRESEQNLLNLCKKIPLLSIQNPYNWQYKVIGLVTGQSVTGTGVFSEINQSISDLFGSQSSSLRAKIRGGEEICFAQIRSHAINLGGNAVIGVDIDYAELGGGRGMVMVSCTGTVVNLTNTEVLDADKVATISQIPAELEKFREMNNILSNYMNQR